MTVHLAKNDPKKFCMSTPKRGSNAYHCVWEGTPSPKQIIEDTKKFLDALKVITNHNGCALEGLENRRGGETTTQRV